MRKFDESVPRHLSRSAAAASAEPFWPAADSLKIEPATPRQPAADAKVKEKKMGRAALLAHKGRRLFLLAAASLQI
jgi:hypothetical protein